MSRVSVGRLVAVADPALARIDGHTLYPLADGGTTTVCVPPG